METSNIKTISIVSPCASVSDFCCCVFLVSNALAVCDNFFLMCFSLALKQIHCVIMADDEGFVVRVRGLPWSCSVEEVSRFFSGNNVEST